MAFEPFGLVGGLGVGIPSVLVIDENGNFVSNVTTTGNVSANVISANTFRFANGANFVTSAAGSNTQVQFNNNGNFSADSSFTFDSSNALLTVSNLAITTFTNLGDISNVSILGGINGYFLQTDGEGALTWSPAGNGGGGNGTPGGANTQVQYNDDGEFGGDASFTYNELTNTLSASNIIATQFTGTLSGNATRAGTVTTNSQPNITSVGTLTSLAIAGNVTAGNANLGNSVTANYFVGNINGNATTAGTVTANAQPNITSVGTLTTLGVTGNITAGNVTSTTFTGNLAGNATTAGTVTTNAQPNITSVGTLSTLSVTGNVTAGNVSATTFTGNLAGNATTAGTVITAAQPNITSVGTLTSLNVTNTISAGNITATIFTGNLEGNATTAGTVITNAQPNITSVGPLVSLEVDGNLYVDTNSYLGNEAQANFFIGDGRYLSNVTVDPNVAVANANYANFAGQAFTSNTVLNGAQPNITSVGTLTALSVGPGATAFSGNVTIANTGTLRVNGNASFGLSPNINLGTISNVHIGGGFANYYLQTDGVGNLRWAMGSGTGSSPGGANTAVQYNSNGQFGGTEYFTYDITTQTVNINGNLIANTLTVGSTGFTWSTSSVFFATTASTSPDQVLYGIPVANICGAEFHIIATDPAGPSRQSLKISSVYYNGTVQYTEYAGLYINGGVGNFGVEYYPGDIDTPPSIQLIVAPNTTDTVTYKMLIIVYAE